VTVLFGPTLLVWLGEGEGQLVEERGWSGDVVVAARDQEVVEFFVDGGAGGAQELFAEGE
jgi:hypothetical protein